VRSFVLGDLHLTRHSSPVVAQAFAALLEDNPASRVVVAGDFFDLMTDAPTTERREAMAAVLAAHPGLGGAIGRFVDRGGELVLLGGNHDADVGKGEVREALADLVAPSAAGRARIHSSPWFVRDGDLHIEHGHFYDPDNAPEHPLVNGEYSLGVHFSAEFIHPTQAHRFLTANDATPLKLLLAAFRWYGPRGPYVVYRYFHAAFAALAKSGPLYRAAAERPLGETLHADFAEAAGVPASMLDDIVAIGARPTLEDFGDTFARLYLDRALSTILAGASLGAAAAGYRKAGAAGAALGSMVLVTSWLHGHNRYRGRVVDCLESAAERIADTTGARHVIFGHTHQEALGPRYANTGSFAFSPGRPYLEVSRRGPELLVERRHAAR
jgi:UDP-2,3-diacylglucosamine pyrophosphatase LpxH